MTKKVKKVPGSTPTVFDDTGPSSSQTPYIEPVADNVQIMSVLSTGDQVGFKDGPPALANTPWRMVGIPDGLGAYDNGDGTMTVLMNHELGADPGVVREHGQTGAFVSKLTIDKETMQVVSAGDLVQIVHYYDRATTLSYRRPRRRSMATGRVRPPVLGGSAGHLRPVRRQYAGWARRSASSSAARKSATRAACSLTSRPAPRRAIPSSCRSSAGSPGRMRWPTRTAAPRPSLCVNRRFHARAKSMCMSAISRSTGNTIEKAGLTNGKLFGIVASFGDDTAATPPNGTFTLVEQGNNGDVSELTGAQQQAEAVCRAHAVRPSGRRPMGSEQSQSLLLRHDRRRRRFRRGCGRWTSSTSSAPNSAARSRCWSRAGWPTPREIRLRRFRS